MLACLLAGFGGCTGPCAAHCALQTDSKTKGTIAQLTDLDRVKATMDSCIRTLAEADSWHQRLHTVRARFETQDLGKVGGLLLWPPLGLKALQIGEELAAMRRSVGAMQKLPSFQARQKELAELEERLEGVATPQLLEALSASLRASAALGESAASDSKPSLAPHQAQIERLRKLVTVFCAIGHEQQANTNLYRSRLVLCPAAEHDSVRPGESSCSTRRTSTPQRPDKTPNHKTPSNRRVWARLHRC